jgi:hypothetical protein
LQNKKNISKGDYMILTKMWLTKYPFICRKPHQNRLNNFWDNMSQVLILFLPWQVYVAEMSMYPSGPTGKFRGLRTKYFGYTYFCCSKFSCGEGNPNVDSFSWEFRSMLD